MLNMINVSPKHLLVHIIFIQSNPKWKIHKTVQNYAIKSIK